MAACKHQSGEHALGMRGRRVYSSVLPAHDSRRRPTVEPDTLNATPLRLGGLTLSVNMLN
jgi:hypothetical protein